jgi:hypothetical protein
MMTSAPRVTRSVIAAWNLARVTGRKLPLASSSYSAWCTLSWVRTLGDQDAQVVVLLQAAGEVAAGHGVATAEQPHGLETTGQNLACGWVDDVEERQIDRLFDVVAGIVDGVPSQQERVGTGGLELVALRGQQVTDQVPAAIALLPFDLRKVGLRQHKIRAVQGAKATCHEFIDRPVVDDRTGPSHAANDADGLHVDPPHARDYYRGCLTPPQPRRPGDGTR